MTTIHEHTIESSVAMFSEAMEREPQLRDSPAGKTCLEFLRGTELMNEQRFFDALNAFDRALELMPKEYPQWVCITRWNRALCYLALGDYTNGFVEFEFRKYTFPHAHDQIPLPDWRGESLKGKRILIYQEQGFGDAIQMLRYIPVVKKLGAEVTLLVDPALVRLAQQLRVTINVLESDKPFDFKCSLFALMPPLKQTVHTVPGTPYLSAKPRELDTKCVKIGLAWSGNAKHAEDKERSIPFDELYRLFDPLRSPHVLAYSMQSDCSIACQFGVRTEPFADFADLAEIMMSMTHIVSVSTAAVCLAGALGHPSVHALIPFNPDWRWRWADKWFPNVKCYRQHRPQDWAGPLARVSNAISGAARAAA